MKNMEPSLTGHMEVLRNHVCKLTDRVEVLENPEDSKETDTLQLIFKEISARLEAVEHRVFSLQEKQVIAVKAESVRVGESAWLSAKSIMAYPNVNENDKIIEEARKIRDYLLEKPDGKESCKEDK